MNHTLQSRACIVLLTGLLVSSPSLSVRPAGARDFGIESIFSSLWSLLERLVPATGQSSAEVPDGQAQPTATPSGSGTGGSGTSSDDDRGSAMDPNG